MAIKTGSTLYLLKIFSFAWYGEFKLLFKKKQNSASFNFVAVTISKMTLRSCEERNCFKGLSLFFLTTT